MSDEVKIISVSEVGLYFGFWASRQDELKGKKVVVMNLKTHRVMGAFQLIDAPIPLTGTCPTCNGKGEVETRIRR